mgnify:CR=1 FL=1
MGTPLSTALITGASSGIGRVFAKKLAAQGTDLVLVARSEDKLKDLASDLEQQFQINAHVIVQDLTQPDGVSHVVHQVNAWGLAIDGLVNNAGFGDYGAFGDRSRQRQLDMIQLNITSLVDLTHQFLPAMQQRRSGAIVNVSSIAGFQPMPYLSVYAATKAFVLSFSEALWVENRDYGVKVVALCPGPTETEFFKVAQFPLTFAEQTPQKLTSPEEVVRDALEAIASNTPTVVSGGLLNQVIVNLPRFFPRPTLANVVGSQFRP